MVLRSRRALAAYWHLSSRYAVQLTTLTLTTATPTWSSQATIISLSGSLQAQAWSSQVTRIASQSEPAGSSCKHVLWVFEAVPAGSQPAGHCQIHRYIEIRRTFGLLIIRQPRDRRRSRYYWARSDHRCRRGGNCNGCWIIPYGQSQIDHPNVVAAENRLSVLSKVHHPVRRRSERLVGVGLRHTDII